MTETNKLILKKGLNENKIHVNISEGLVEKVVSTSDKFAKVIISGDLKKEVTSKDVGYKSFKGPEDGNPAIITVGRGYIKDDNIDATDHNVIKHCMYEILESAFKNGINHVVCPPLAINTDGVSPSSVISKAMVQGIKDFIEKYPQAEMTLDIVIGKDIGIPKADGTMLSFNSSSLVQSILADDRNAVLEEMASKGLVAHNEGTRFRS